ncbi:MAG: ABC transporter substrate-binding protein [Pseudomonadota bacterium]
MRSAIVKFIAASSLAAAIALTPWIESAAVAAEPIVFGLVDEVTGPQAEAGVLQVQGAKLAVEEINAAGGILGRQVEIRIEDNQSANPTTVLAYTKLIEAGVVAVIGPLRSTQVLAASPTIALANRVRLDFLSSRLNPTGRSHVPSRFPTARKPQV